MDNAINFIGQDVALFTGLTYAYLLLMMFPYTIRLSRWTPIS